MQAQITISIDVYIIMIKIIKLGYHYIYLDSIFNYTNKNKYYMVFSGKIR